MKRIYVCLLIFLCFAFVQAQKIKTPCFALYSERIQQVKQRIVNDLKMAEGMGFYKRRRQMNSCRKRI